MKSKGIILYLELHIKPNHNLIQQQNNTVKYLANFIFWYFVLVSDASLEKVREILDYLKGDKPDDELAVFILIRSSLKRVPQIKKLSILSLFSYWISGWLFHHKQWLISKQMQVMNYKIVLHLYKYKFLNVINKTEKKMNYFLTNHFLMSLCHFCYVYIYICQ